MSTELCLALDIGGTNIKFGIVSKTVSEQELALTDFQVVPTSRSAGPQGLVQQIADIYQSSTSNYKLKSSEPIPVGISCAGPLDPVEGRLLIPANLTDGGEAWSNFPLAQEVRDKLKVDVRLENDAAAAALGELWLGKGKGIKDFMILSLGTGLGVGVVRDGQVVRAAGGLHTELGHMIINFDETPPLEEARVNGSLESYLGPKFFLLRFSKARGVVTTGEEFLELVKSKDPLATKWAASFQQVLLSGMFNFFLAFAPEVFIFQGGFSPLITLFQKELEEAFRERVEGFSRTDRPSPRVEVSNISRSCGVFGAAYRVFS